jgi:glycosyltransferase involved in cell wall biosynthesis
VNIVICATQIPFMRGGAEVHVEGLRDALRQAGHRVDIVALPFKWYPLPEILSSALAWRLLDLTEANGVPIDLVICTKFPTWAVKHPNKIAWVIHQHRQAYDLYGTSLSEFTNSEADNEVRRRIFEIDRRGLGECKALFANSRNVARRLRESIGLEAEPLHVPITLKGLEPEAYGDFIFSVSRLDRAKRIDLLLDALAAAGEPYMAIIAGEGPEADALRKQARRLGIAHRAIFTGRLADCDVVAYYNEARAVYYAPVDEDFGLVTVEAFTAAKPVLTAADAGGVLELVEHDQTGIVVDEARPELLALGIRRLLDDAEYAQRLGERARTRSEEIRWDRVVDRLLAHA